VSTTCVIAKQTSEGFRAITCNWDGYIEFPGVGYFLVNHYEDPDKIDKLLDLGNISILSKEIGVQHPFPPINLGARKSYAKLYGGMTVAYARDRGEEMIEAGRYETFNELLSRCRVYAARYLYVHRDDEWLWLRINIYGFAYRETDLSVLSKQLVIETERDELVRLLTREKSDRNYKRRLQRMIAKLDKKLTSI
jgi:hypothetical protein